MDTTRSEDKVDDARYRIGAVCRMTGLSPHVLRVWEKRYGVVEPKRLANQRRLYTETDINKLSLLKRLVDRGQAIGTLIDLDIDELERRTQQAAHVFDARSPEERPTLIGIGESLQLAANSAGQGAFQVVGNYRDAAGALEDDDRPRADVVVYESPSVQPDTGRELSRLLGRLSARHLIVVYDYASAAALRNLKSSRVTAVRSPLQTTTLDALVARLFGAGQASGGPIPSKAGPAPARQYTERQLARIAKYSAQVECECPEHLSALVVSLTRFEDYSAECENRNAQDATLHSYLFSTAAQARNLLENALTRVIEMEGFDTGSED